MWCNLLPICLCKRYGLYELPNWVCCIELNDLACDNDGARLPVANAAAVIALLAILSFFSCATRCSGGWKYLHVSREHLPFIKSTHTMTSEFSWSTGHVDGGWACSQSAASFLHELFWKSLQIWGFLPEF